MSLTCTYTPRRRVMLSSIIHLVPCPALTALAALVCPTFPYLPCFLHLSFCFLCLWIAVLSFFKLNSRPLPHQTQQDRRIAPRRLQPHKARAAQVPSLSWKYCAVTRAIVLSGCVVLPMALCSTTRPLRGHSIHLEDNAFLVTTPRGLSPVYSASLAHTRSACI